MTQQYIYLPYDGFPLGWSSEEPGLGLAQMQLLVGGTIEATTPATEIVVWLNDEGRMAEEVWKNRLATQINWPVYGYDMVGDAFITSNNHHGANCGLCPQEIAWLQQQTDGELDLITFDMTFNEVLSIRDIRRSNVPQPDL